MKVVLFCGGFGMRLREYSEVIPKPMVQIGYRPILWHVMKYYAHFGHKDFIICLGWKAHLIKEYFLNYDECASNDFVLSAGGKSIDLLSRDIHDWKITFIDTGAAANIGQRLNFVKTLLDGEETFLANYTDGLTDLHLPDLIERHQSKQAIASFLSVKPTQTFHKITADETGTVEAINQIGESDVWMNGGYFVLDSKIFDYIEEGDELVVEPFARLIAQQRLCTLKYGGFWSCMDTYKEKQDLDDRYTEGDTPWEVWNQTPEENSRPAQLGGFDQAAPVSVIHTT